jgi:hypothetical protein
MNLYINGSNREKNCYTILNSPSELAETCYSSFKIKNGELKI